MKHKAAFDSAGTELGVPILIIKPHFTEGKPDTKRARDFPRALNLRPNSTLEKPDFLRHSNVTNKTNALPLAAFSKRNEMNEKSGSCLYSSWLGICCGKIQ
jgi:hypothetical protein